MRDAVRILEVVPDGPEARANVAEAAARLRAGGLVAFPTETVYGLGARALDPAAVERVFATKGRPKGHPLIVHVRDEVEARAVASAWSARASRLAGDFWPGPLTLVVPRAPQVPDAVTGGLATVAVRAPAHPVALALLGALGEPIVAPSANRFQRLSPTRAEHVARSLGDADVLVLDGGPCARGLESTVVDVTGPRARVLRPGPVTRAALEAALGEPVEERAEAVPTDEARRAPGMDARHYAPRARLLLANDDAEAQALAAAWTGPGRAVRLRLPDDPDAASRALYAELHALDDAGVGAIVAVLPPQGDAWGALRDRLRRAAALPA
jgi:L-threonylcarbamoyladenylate synthase